jgi:hypothetical protein
MRVRVLVAVTMLAAASLPVGSYADPVQSGAPPQTGASDPDQVVCRITPPPTGTRLGGGHVCHTQREWDERQKEAQKELMERQMPAGLSASGSSGK